MKTIGFVHSGSKASFVRHFAAIDTGLAVMGYKKDTDYTITAHWADDKPNRLRDLTKALVQNDDVNVIIAAGGPVPALVAQELTAKEIDKKPVVFTTVVNPPGIGLVADNLTGMAGKTSELDDDRIRFLSKLLKAQTAAPRKLNAMFKKGRPNLAAHKVHLKNITNGLDLEFGDEEVEDDVGIDNVFAAGLTAADGVVVTADSFFNNKREKIVRKAAERGIPAIYQWREFVEIGGLMSYGPSIIEAYVFAGAYAARILKNNNKIPADMDLSEPTQYELVINRTTAASLKLTIPDSLKDDAELID